MTGKIAEELNIIKTIKCSIESRDPYMLTGLGEGISSVPLFAREVPLTYYSSPGSGMARLVRLACYHNGVLPLFPAHDCNQTKSQLCDVSTNSQNSFTLIYRPL